MTYQIVLIRLDKRRDKALDVQKVLTEYGCNIKVRLGLHNSQDGVCGEDGLIVLDVKAEDTRIEELIQHLNQQETVTAKYIKI